MAPKRANGAKIPEKIKRAPKNGAKNAGKLIYIFLVIGDSGEDYLYTKENPAPLDGCSLGGRWEIVEE